MQDDKDLRPPFCFDDNCQCLLNPQGLCVENIKKGFSGTCFGKMRVPVDWKFNKINHINSYYLCVYSPFKGWMRFAMDFNDLRAVKMGVLTLLQIADEHPEEQEAINKIYQEREAYQQEPDRETIDRAYLNLGPDIKLCRYCPRLKAPCVYKDEYTLGCKDPENNYNKKPPEEEESD